jgi:hypothetical protein
MTAYSTPSHGCILHSCTWFHTPRLQYGCILHSPMHMAASSTPAHDCILHSLLNVVALLNSSTWYVLHLYTWMPTPVLHMDVYFTPPHGCILNPFSWLHTPHLHIAAYTIPVHDCITHSSTWFLLHFFTMLHTPLWHKIRFLIFWAVFCAFGFKVRKKY